MKSLVLPLFNFSNGAIIMTAVFALVILGLVGVVFMLMNSDKKKEENE